MLPFLKNYSSKTAKQPVSFRGINYGDMIAFGDMASTCNLTVDRYPYLSVRRAREKQKEYHSCTALTARDKLIAVQGTDLLYGNEVIAQVSPGEKQFVYINNQLVVWPDKITVKFPAPGEEEKKPEVENMEASINVDLSSERGRQSCGKLIYHGNEYQSGKQSFVVYEGGCRIFFHSYGSRPDMLEECFELGRWNTEKLSKLQSVKDLYFDNAKAGELFIPAYDPASGEFSIVCDQINPDEANPEEAKPEDAVIDTALYNTEGYYGILSSNGQAGGGVMDRNEVSFKIYKVGSNTACPFLEYEVGDAITIEGTPYGVLDVENALITDASKDGRTLLYSTTPTAPIGCYVLDRTLAQRDENVEDNMFKFQIDTVRTDENTGKDIKTGRYVYVWSDTQRVLEGSIIVIEAPAEGEITDNSMKAYVWDEEKKEVKLFLGCENNTFSDGAEILSLPNLLDGLSFTLKRAMPKLDFICEKDNRLWGVSNETKTVYASALGSPRQFFDYSGLSTDSYAVAVGTAGDFTGCSKLGSSVLFWKETCLHKILGDYPAEYTMYTYDIEGVQKGSHKSLQVINEALYYKGLHGFYAFTGSTPRLISGNFGMRDFENAVAGSDGERYYVSAEGEDGYSLMVYDIATGFWIREDDTDVADFARMGKNLYFANSSGDVWLCDSGSTDMETKWWAQFCPFEESLQGRKRWQKLLLRVELPEGAWLKVSVSCDGGKWAYCGKILGKDRDTVPLLFPINRCDRIEVKFEGEGPCVVRSMLLEYSMGSDV